MSTNAGDNLWINSDQTNTYQSTLRVDTTAKGGITFGPSNDKAIYRADTIKAYRVWSPDQVADWAGLVAEEYLLLLDEGNDPTTAREYALTLIPEDDRVELGYQVCQYLLWPLIESKGLLTGEIEFFGGGTINDQYAINVSPNNTYQVRNITGTTGDIFINGNKLSTTLNPGDELEVRY